MKPLDHRVLVDEHFERRHTPPRPPVGEASRDAGKRLVDVRPVAEEASVVAEGELRDGVEGPVAQPVVEIDFFFGRGFGLQTIEEELEGAVNLGFLLEPSALGETRGDFLLDVAHALFVAKRDQREEFFAVAEYDERVVGWCLLNYIISISILTSMGIIYSDLGIHFFRSVYGGNGR